MSVDHTEYHKTLREHAKQLLVCEATPIGSEMELGATTTGYTRADGGSFIDDGFVVGMEIVAAGYTKSANNGVRTLKAVSDSALTVQETGNVSESAFDGPSVSVGLPALREWENVKFARIPRRAYVKEQYLPGPTYQATIGPNGDLELAPMYALHINVPDDTGIDADGAYADAILNHFTPRSVITTPSGVHIRVRTDAGPFRAQRLQPVPGWSTVPVTIPCRIRVPNTI